MCISSIDNYRALVTLVVVWPLSRRSLHEPDEKWHEKGREERPTKKVIDGHKRTQRERESKREEEEDSQRETERARADDQEVQ